MPLRAPRRRISVRTKRRCRAIKGFLQRALGTSSQADIKTNSSIEVSVSDLKNKIIGIEEQLDKVSKHCRDSACFEHSLRNDSENSLVQAKDGVVTKAEDYDKNVEDLETKSLYNTSNSLFRKSVESDNGIKLNGKDAKKNMMSVNHDVGYFQCDPENNEFQKKNRYKNEFDLPEKHRRIKYKSIKSVYSTSSFHSLVESANKYYPKPGYSAPEHEKRHTRKEYTEPLILKEHRNRPIIEKDISRDKAYNDRHRNTKRTKRNYSELDKEFIAELIKRQYKPVKLFGRRDSDFSQFSAPVCRDQEYTIREEIQEGSDLCSCCFDECRKRKYRYLRNSDLSDMRSICDTRLYSSKKHRRYKSRDYADDYNNSAFYDIVPVKEKSSPKARKKISNDNMIAYQYCKEVPPSPKSHRPRLNLKAQHYTDYEDNLVHEKHVIRRNSPIRETRKKAANLVESDRSSDSYPQRKPEIKNNAKSPEPTHTQEDVGTMSNLQYLNFHNEQTNLSNNDTLNTQLTDSTADKTDKTLCEIKDILQTFLIEIKKESTHSEKSHVTSKIEHKQLSENQESIKTNPNIIPNSGHSFNNYSVGQCGMPPFLPAFPNPCCYPILPLCPMNCLQNGYIIPSPSYTCNVCAKNSKEPGCTGKESCHNKTKEFEEIHANNETQELIKEIYKFVSQKPKSYRTIDQCGKENSTDKCKYQQNIFDKSFLTTRSVGGSTKASKHDANVGTPNMKCYSKSCEAFGSRINSDTYNTTNASYSDTVIEKLSLEATHSSSETDLSKEVPEEKVKRGKFKKVLNSLKLFRKKKKDVIEELSESESTVEVEINRRPPFKQHITNYAMHGQQYFHPPPIPRQCCHSPHPDDFRHGYEARHGYSQQTPYVFNHHKTYPYEHIMSPHSNPSKYPTAPPFPTYVPRYDRMPPQVPLCLKEIEVKSIGTQSERKMSMFRKLTKNAQPLPQTKPTRLESAPRNDKPSFWKTFQEKAKQNGNDPMDFTIKTRKELAQDDMKLRNAMLKKMFYKRNPFSPRNLIVRTLLGKDKSSYGDPPKMYRPRMFL